MMPYSNDLRLKLVYKDGCPVFQNAEKEGEQLLVHFGANRRDRDYDCIPTVLFSIYILATEGNDAWVADYHGTVTFSFEDEESQPFIKQAPKVKEMVDSINNAIENCRELDLTDYLRSWRQLDVEYLRTFIEKLDDYWKKYYSNRHINEHAGEFK